MAQLVTRETTGKVKTMLTRIAIMGAGYAVIGKEKSDGSIGNRKRIDLDKYQPFQDFIADLIRRYPDKSRYGRDININISSYRGYRVVDLERVTDPNYRYGAVSFTPVDLNLNRAERSGNSTYYQYTLPESVVRTLIKGVAKYGPQVDTLWDGFYRGIYSPVVNKAIEDKENEEKAAAEKKKADEERISKYIKFSAFDSPQNMADKMEQVFGPHYKELDMYGHSSDARATTWELFKKKYEDEIPDMGQAEHFVQEANSSFSSARFFHDYGYYPSSRKNDEDEDAEWTIA